MINVRGPIKAKHRKSISSPAKLYKGIFSHLRQDSNFH